MAAPTIFQLHQPSAQAIADHRRTRAPAITADLSIALAASAVLARPPHDAFAVASNPTNIRYNIS
jgi:hypothetical protein